ncbi:MAG: CHAT domain-containing protein, partial [Caldilineaceae bacterium]|nr:CHAT domain-containing protein [Caldilineaceae bacterium]
MPGDPIFISHATADDAFVRDLRLALEGLGHAVWVDSRNLRGGDLLAAEIEAAIRAASGFVAVLSPQTVNSPWVKREIDLALATQAERGPAYRLLPLLLPGVKPAALGMWFSREPVAVPVELAPGKLAEALPAILAGLGLRLPEDKETLAAVTPQPVDELILELRDPTFARRKGVRRPKAEATLVYRPADLGQRAIESKRYTVHAPLGPIEMEEMRWYLEDYYVWPVGVFQERAGRTEAALPGWGNDLYRAALGADAAQEALNAWRQAGDGRARRFSVWVDSDPPEGASKKRRAEAAEAASEWLALPWELLHDGGGYLMHGARAAHVRRRLPNRRHQPVRLAQLPIRILLASPRPEVDEDGNPVPYIDHRASALPLVAAVEKLGDLARVHVLTPPTLPALEAELARAARAGEPYEVVHFDGHGVYDRQVGLGALLFEHPGDAGKLDGRRMDLVHAETLAAILRDHGIPLVFLEACQTAQSATDPLASVAARLLAEGVNSVAAMRASVLVTTAQRFVEAFYQALAQGQRVGEAMLAGQRALAADPDRGAVMGAGRLRLRDWFVPVLYQEEADPPLFGLLPGQAAQQLQAQQRQQALGALPAPPAHRFVGRSHELLRLERLLAQRPYAVVRGTGGAGKTTLAVELARWLARSGRCRRVAFASLETIHDDRGLLDSLGRQLVPGPYSVAEHPDLDRALQPVERALRDHPTLIVIDNVESVLPVGEDDGRWTIDDDPPPGGDDGPSSIVYRLSSIVHLCTRLLAASPATRLVFTSRERLPAPFADAGAVQELGHLSRHDAVRLVEQVLAQHGWTPPPHDDGRTPDEVTALVKAVQGHARALVLLAPEVARRGVRAVTADLRGLLAELERRHPGQRENSLYASVELSLRRLPPPVRQAIRALAVFQGGGHVDILGMVMGVEPDQARAIAVALIE